VSERREAGYPAEQRAWPERPSDEAAKSGGLVTEEYI
jgi:hypothetical protein